MYYITGASAISHQPSFRNKGYSSQLIELTPSAEIISPIYKDFINSAQLRRMSKILRMAVTSALDCVDQSKQPQADAIIVGTGLGCLQDTEKFLENFLTIDGLLPPTAFIQSTHNTIAGQISLLLKNHSYNMTHTQNSLSFEHALMDACMHINEGKKNVLVGAADEHIEILDNIVVDLHLDFLLNKMTSNAVFFNLSKNKTDQCIAKIINTEAFSFVDSPDNILETFLSESGIDINQIDLVLTNCQLPESISSVSQINYTALFGYNYVTSAMALHYAVDLFESNAYNTILIYNKLGNNMGLTLATKSEA